MIAVGIGLVIVLIVLWAIGMVGFVQWMRSMAAHNHTMSEEWLRRNRRKNGEG